MVVMRCPTASSTKVEHEGTGRSPSITVQAPQAARSHPIFVPVRPS